MRKLNTVAAEGDVPRCLCNSDPHLTLEPLPMSVHERDERDGRAADVRRQGGQVIEFLFRGGIEDLIAFQRGQPLALIGCGSSRCHML
jgi:hypothetical protein